MMSFTSRTYLLPEGTNILIVLYLKLPFIKIIIVITVILVSISKLSLDLVATITQGPVVQSLIRLILV